MKVILIGIFLVLCFSDILSFILNALFKACKWFKDVISGEIPGLIDETPKNSFLAERKTYSRLAKKWDAQLHDSSSPRPPKLSFVYKTTRAELSVYESRQSPPRYYTQMIFPVSPGWSSRLEVFPQKRNRRKIEWDYRTGDERFDERYVVKTNDPSFAKRYLVTSIRDTMNRLRAMSTDKVLVSLHPDRLLVRIPTVLSEIPILERFRSFSGTLYDQFYDLWQEESGIEIMDQERETGTVPTVCQVCGVSFEKERTVTCRKCRTLHHHDCWEYNEGCSTFACGSQTSDLRS